MYPGSTVTQTVTVVAQWVTVEAQQAKAPGIHCYVAGSIPAVTTRYCTKKIENALWSTKKRYPGSTQTYPHSPVQVSLNSIPWPAIRLICMQIQSPAPTFPYSLEHLATSSHPPVPSLPHIYQPPVPSKPKLFPTSRIGTRPKELRKLTGEGGVANRWFLRQRRGRGWPRRRGPALRPCGERWSGNPRAARWGSRLSSPGSGDSSSRTPQRQERGVGYRYTDQQVLSYADLLRSQQQ